MLYEVITRTDLLRLQAEGVAPLMATDDWLPPDAAQLLLQAVQHNQLAQTRLPWLAWQPLAVPSWLLVVHTDPQSLTYGLWRWLGLLLAGLVITSYSIHYTKLYEPGPRT